MKKYLSTLIVATITLFAACSNDDDKTVYTVMFETGGGTPVPAAQKIEEGRTASAPSTNPEKAGYAFVYWHLSRAATAYNFQDPVKGNITLQAKWQEEAIAEYWQVAWELNGGAWPSGDNHATQVLKGGTLAEPAEPTKSGKTFEGWYKESALTNKVAFPYNVSNVTDNFTLYAKWATEGGELSVSPNNTPISFTSAGGTSESITVSTDQSSWDAISNQTWCVVKKSGNQFTVTASDHTASTERKATVTVSAGKAPKITIEVTQAGVLSVVKAKYTVPNPSVVYFQFQTVAYYTLTWPVMPGCTEYNVYKSRFAIGIGYKTSLVTTTSDLTVTLGEIFTPNMYMSYGVYYWVTAITNSGETPQPDNEGIKVTYKVTSTSVDRTIEQNPIQ